MNRSSTLIALLAAGSLISAQAQSAAASDPPGRKPASKHRRTAKSVNNTAQEIQELRDEMQAQQQQIDALKSQLATRDEQVVAAQKSALDAETQAVNAATANAQLTTQQQQTSSQISTLQTTVDDLKAVNAGLQATVVANQQQVEEQINAPASLHYKGVTITPVAFFAFEGVWRQRAVNSGLNTPFNSIPFPAANEGHMSELNFSGRQSRLGALFTGDAGRYKLSGYIEADFLSSGTTSNNNQSNSYTLRQRQFWGRAETASRFAVTGGQMWSLVTETGRSTDNRTEKLPNTIDPQYMVGFNWTRQPAIRLQQQFGDMHRGLFTAAMSLEQAQITNFTATSATSGAVPANFYFAGAGANGGLYNAFNGTYANNVAPDVIVKGTLDYPHAHLELGGLARFLRDFYFPIQTATANPTTGAVTYTYAANSLSHTAAAGGAFGSIRVSPSPFVDVAFQAMAGQGVGRYGSSQLADATLRPDGTLEPIRNYHGLFSLETHPARKLDVYAYYGGEYAQRTVYATPTGALIGYGAPNLVNTGCYALPANPGSATGGSDSASNCNSPTRYIQEGMFGLTYRVVNSPKYGRLQYQVTYSYLQRNLWSGIGSTVTPAAPRAQDNMIDTSMRYYIP